MQTECLQGLQKMTAKETEDPAGFAGNPTVRPPSFSFGGFGVALAQEWLMEWRVGCRGE
ncbi:hypothetical protein [Desulfacinum infernum]|uniref:hypothetical protein n=1 Tax=Desulfacinum infernum TaxID=35837 RepID=UPI0015B41058|nr:hypothetical protein [Desulfacinum infernum]